MTALSSLLPGNFQQLLLGAIETEAKPMKIRSHSSQTIE